MTTATSLSVPHSIERSIAVFTIQLLGVQNLTVVSPKYRHVQVVQSIQGLVFKNIKRLPSQKERHALCFAVLNVGRVNRVSFARAEGLWASSFKSCTRAIVKLVVFSSFQDVS